jgi:hypothetical protein
LEQRSAALAAAIAESYGNVEDACAAFEWAHPNKLVYLSDKGASTPSGR